MKNRLCTLFILGFLLAGCSTSGEVEQVGPTEYENDRIGGKHLDIAVIGKPSKGKFPGVSFHQEYISALEDKRNYYDAFFINGEFEELSGEKWTPIFQNISTPLFFFNSKCEPLVFFEEGMRYDANCPKATFAVKGYKDYGQENSDSWGYGNPDPDGNANIPVWAYMGMFEEIEKYSE